MNHVIGVLRRLVRGRGRLLLAMSMIGVTVWQVSRIEGPDFIVTLHTVFAREPQQGGGVTPQPPQPDGSIIHYVQFGDTLSGIALAYHVTIDQIRELNKLPANSNIVVTGQKLIIKLAPTAAPANVTVVVITATMTPAGGEAPASPPAGTAAPAATSQPNASPPTEVATQAAATVAPSSTPTPIPLTPTATVVPLDQTASVCITAFNDANTNHWQDLDEKLLAGVDLALSQGSGAAQKMSTTADGPSCFKGIATGTYTVNAAPPSGYGGTTPTQLEVDVKAGAHLTLTFGVAQGYQPPQASGAATADASIEATPPGQRSTGIIDTVSRNSGLIVLGLAGLVLLGGIAVTLLARRH